MALGKGFIQSSAKDYSSGYQINKKSSKLKKPNIIYNSVNMKY